MAARKPIVINAGQLQQLQSGDVLDATITGGEGLVLTNSESTPIVIGTAVYIFGADAVKKARANASGTARGIGLVADASITNGTTGTVKIDGVLVATTGQWDTITGGSGGLVANTVYYVDASTAGNLTSTAPSAVGQLVTQIGVAVSTTELLIDPQNPILL